MLNDNFWMAVPLCLLVIGWLLAKHEPAVIRILLRIALALIAVMFFVQVITGLQHSSWRQAHRWTSYLFLFLVWTWAGFSLGVVWWQRWPRIWGLLWRTLLLSASAGVVFLASITGYLGPTHAVAAGEETYNRFIVQHYFFFPLLLFVSIGLFTWIEGRRSRSP